MSFRSSDLVPLWDRGPDFLPLRPPGGSHQWSFARVREELTEAAETMDKAAAERRVALLSSPGLAPGVATDGLNVGIQMLLPGESAAAHRHTPAALRIGLEGQGVVTTVDGVEYRLEPQDLVLNPTGTWHGHHAADGGLWLDVVDLPLVGALGGVLFEPS